MKNAEKIREQLKEKARLLPDKPGIYQFVDQEGNILYIGKARSLRKRVASYFTGDRDGKTRVMISKSRDIRHIVVETESDALLLENNLVKKHQPRYNIQLKDDKTFPWIVIKNERFPRVFPTRNRINDGSEYFGPYTSALMVRTLLDLVRQLYPLRTCKYTLSEENILNQKYKPCLEYHMGNCKAPCAGWQEEPDYRESIDQIRHILKGNTDTVLGFLGEQMQKKAAAYRFEEAAMLKDKIGLLSKFQSKSTVVSPKISNVEVYSLAEDQDLVFVNFLKVFNGAIIQAHTLELRRSMDESREEILLTAITEMRQRTASNAPEILVPFNPGMEIAGAVFHVPVRGDKKKLLDLSARNAVYYRLDRQKERESAKKPAPETRKLETIRRDLGLRELPVHMECFDNSNIQGKYPVAACVVFRNAVPSKKEYRHYNIKTVTGINDFASMEEVVYRRYRRLLDEQASLPQLVVIDGGKGQLRAAVNSLEKLNLRGKISVIGIAKRLEEIYFPGDSIPLYLDKRSESLKVIQYMRNEAHRFGISFHRQKRSAPVGHSELENIKGIGEQSVKSLYEQFRDMQGIRSAGFPGWKDLLGEKKARLLQAYFSENK